MPELIVNSVVGALYVVNVRRKGLEILKALYVINGKAQAMWSVVVAQYENATRFQNMVAASQYFRAPRLYAHPGVVRPDEFHPAFR